MSSLFPFWIQIVLLILEGHHLLGTMVNALHTLSLPPLIIIIEQKRLLLAIFYG